MYGCIMFTFRVAIIYCNFVVICLRKVVVLVVV